jgi:hypothetical protein
VNWPDGEVLPDVTWQVSPPEIATVSPNGVLNMLAPGEVEVQATFGKAKGSRQLAIGGELFTVSGSIHQSAPSDDVELAGATVEITKGVYAGRATSTDADGYFSLGRLAGPLELSITKAGYEAGRWSGTISEAQDILLFLRLEFRLVQDVFRDACFSNVAPCDLFIHPLAIHHDGTVEIDVRVWTYDGFVSLELRRKGGERIAQWERFCDDNSPLRCRERVSAAVRGGFVYELRAQIITSTECELKVTRPI